ncbi:hypothetical protein VARIO8X_120418 [Burkholderiales bacterium 8X]|nr:hypothetical protein VARIO8X_120418 [Burkholderiales bacterium 8X]
MERYRRAGQQRHALHRARLPARQPEGVAGTAQEPDAVWPERVHPGELIGPVRSAPAAGRKPARRSRWSRLALAPRSSRSPPCHRRTRRRKAR